MESSVEQFYLKKFKEQLIYKPTEKIGIVIVDNFPELGTLTALRFLEWVQNNPEGVISLPTGKTPEYFIKETKRFIEGWETKEIQKEIEEKGLDPTKKPDLRGLHFVQIDEFYPISPRQHNSFYFYVNKFYIDNFGLDRNKALLINCEEIGLPNDKRLEDIWPDGRVDLSLRYKNPKTKLEETQKEVLLNVDQWCVNYEEKIKRLGGIGFFLGGIGPDGHIGFNILGSDFHSTTRLTQTNYETQAAAATDLGGIEIAKNRLVITIGLETITHNPNCTAVIIAAGEAKAKVVSKAIQNEMNIRYPATVLQKLKNARFFLTKGAAKLLVERNKVQLTNQTEISWEEIEKVIIDLSIEKNKKLSELSKENFKENPLASIILKKYPSSISKFLRETEEDIKKKIIAGSTIESGVTFLHTEPHHDDLMLGYLPYIVRHIRDHSTTHYFATMTSGFTSVTNTFMLNQLFRLKKKLESGDFDHLFASDYFEPSNVIGKNRDVWQYLDGVAADSEEIKEDGELRRLTRNIIAIFGDRDINWLKSRIEELIQYFKTQYPGKKDTRDIQVLKGMSREWEADCLWGYFGWHSDSIFHMRLGFYKGNIFTDEPTFNEDVKPVVKLLYKTNPDIVSVAFDPEASGPDTHYKVLQAITEALKTYTKETGRTDIRVLGYRNVWYKFHPAEANIFVPVSLNMFALQRNAFLNSFLTQREASFPSYEHDGPFCELAQKIQVNQYQILKTCLGREYFNEHRQALIRGTRGMVFLKMMELEEFYKYSRELKKGAENL